MRVNTSRSMQLARQVKGRFGTWQQVREGASVSNGVYVVDGRNRPSAADAPRNPPAR